MSDIGRTEWTDDSWNPVIGCTKVSNGCANCTAEMQAGRFSKPGQMYEGIVRNTPFGARWTKEVRVVEERMNDPLRILESRVIWVNSMSDLYHDKVSTYDIARIYAVMVKGSHHTFQVLTKRIDRALRLHSDAAFVRQVRDLSGHRNIEWPLKKLWLGVSIEDQKSADDRIPKLMKTPATFKFLSCQPLLEEVDIRLWLTTGQIGWAVMGAEAGPKCRPANVDAILKLSRQFKETGVPCLRNWSTL